jgi:transaldolase
MKFFVDTADVAEIRELSETGLVDGVTTNPSLVAKIGPGLPRGRGRDLRHRRRAGLRRGHRHRGRRHGSRGTQAGRDRRQCDRQGAAYNGRAQGLPLAHPVRHQVNVTLCFSANQALLAAKAGATFVSPFIGRLDDIGLDGMDLIEEIRQIYDNYEFD